MDDFINYKKYQTGNSKERTHDVISKFLFPFGSLLIGIIGLWTSAAILPVWTYWMMALYLAIVLVIILTPPTKNFIANSINFLSRKKFAKNSRTELQRLSVELNELLGSDRTNTIPYFLSHQSSKLSYEANLLNCLERSRQQFTILQSWAWSVSDNFKYDNNKLFLRDTNQFSKIVHWFSWACLWVQQVLSNNGVQDKAPKDVLSDWNLAAQRISDFTARVTRIMKSVNNKYNTNLCTEYFEDVKTL